MAEPPDKKKARTSAPTITSLPAPRRPSMPMLRPPEPGRSETVVLRDPKKGKPKPKPKSIDKR